MRIEARGRNIVDAHAEVDLRLGKGMLSTLNFGQSSKSVYQLEVAGLLVITKFANLLLELGHSELLKLSFKDSKAISRAIWSSAILGRNCRFSGRACISAKFGIGCDQ